MIRTAVVLLALAALALAHCDRAAPPPSTTTNLPHVVCTTGMVADIARNVALDHARVTAIMGEGVDPHLYKPNPSDVHQLSEAAIIFYNGLHLEGKMGEIFEQVSKARPVVAVGEHIDHAQLMTPIGAQGAHDPHIWFDVSLWAQTIDPVRDALAKLDPAHAAEFAVNADTYRARLATLHAEAKDAIARIPEGSRVLVTAHDAFGYFARAYGLEVHAIQGISTESEAALKDINDLVDLLVSRNVPAVFVESSVPPRNIEALVEGCRARGHSVRIGGSLFSDAMGAPGTPEGTYEGMVRHNVKTIVEGLTPHSK